jgi:hypothetical protein
LSIWLLLVARAAAPVVLAAAAVQVVLGQALGLQSPQEPTTQLLWAAVVRV